MFAQLRKILLVSAALVITVLAQSACKTAGSSVSTFEAEDDGSLVSRYEQAGVEVVVPPAQIAGLEQEVVGKGPRAAEVLWQSGRKPSRNVTVFLHAWLPVPPSAYADWIRHLANQGKTIFYPIYQGRKSQLKALLPNLVAGVMDATRSLPIPPRSVDLIGHTTGGALAFDYAAVAGEKKLPPARSVVAVYPGRNPGGHIPQPDPSQIPANTRLVVITGPGNRLPNGAQEARDLLKSATAVPPKNRFLLSAPYPSPDGPLRSNPEARRSFWMPADRVARAPD